MSITIRFLRERGDLRWRAIECVLVSYAFIHIHEYLNYKIRIFYHFDQMAMSQLLFDSKVCKIG